MNSSSLILSNNPNSWMHHATSIIPWLCGWHIKSQGSLCICRHVVAIYHNGRVSSGRPFTGIFSSRWCHFCHCPSHGHSMAAKMLIHHCRVKDVHCSHVSYMTYFFPFNVYRLKRVNTLATIESILLGHMRSVDCICCHDKPLKFSYWVMKQIFVKIE